MNTFHRALRALVRVLLALTLFNIAGCNSATGIDKNSTVSGDYTISGVREAVSELHLKKDGHFVYTLAYGGLDETGTGTWRADDKEVTLIVSGKVPSGWQGATTKLRREGKDLLLKIYGKETLYRQKEADRDSDFARKALSSKKYEEAKVDIVGYNYTDKFIGAFEVNGNSGGTLLLSGPDESGGGPYCCFKYMIHESYPYQVEVTWAESSSDKKRTHFMAKIPQPETTDLEYLEVHFYPDGHVELKLTNDYGPPRLKLTHHDGKRDK